MTLEEYHTILLGHIIKVYTDHKNLTFDNFTTDRVRRWRVIIEEYGSKIIYIKGCTNVVADTLSRYPRKECTLSPNNEAFVADNDQDEVFPLTFEVISESQQNDQQLLRAAQSNQDYSTKLLLRSRVIHYKNKIVIPQTLQNRVIEWYHTTLLHPGVNQTIKSTNQHFLVERNDSKY
jgi:hypothetical protein